MRLGILSDVHANLQALRVVLERLDREGVDLLVCLGDVVGYGGDPEACVALVRERVHTCILGNHDLAAVHARVRRSFNAAARVAIEAHARWLEDADLAYLRLLPVAERIEAPGGETLFLIHGTPGESVPFTYLFGSRQAGEALRAFDERFGAVGHTHVPVIYQESQDGGSARELPLRSADPYAAADEVQELSLADGTRAILNPGSVGQPRDGDPRAACMVLDLETGSAVELRLTYDLASAQAAIRRRGLPEVLAARLELGR